MKGRKGKPRLTRSFSAPRMQGMEDAWNKIERARRIQGFTIGALCQAADVAERSYYLHRGRGTLTPRLAERLSAVLGIKIRQAWTVEADTA